jgi:CBS domain-containing protein
MTTNVATIHAAATVAEAVTKLKDTGLRSLIVERSSEEDAYGILTTTDIVYKVVAKGLDPRAVHVHEVMTKPCIVVNPDLEVEQIAALFANTGIRRAPVIAGRLLGIVSSSDILRKAL